MNPILEDLYPGDNVVAGRQAKGYPPLDLVRDQYTAYLHLEMWLCYLNGLDHAAVVMSCALIDYAVKNALYVKAYVDGGCSFSPDEWDKIDCLEFGEAINMAKGRGVVTKDDWELLEWIRVHIRNEYMHGATPKWLKDKEMGVVTGDLETGAVHERTVTLREDLSLQRQARIRADRNVCNKVIPLVDRLVRVLVQGIHQRVEEWRQRNPSTATRAQVERVLENIRKQGLSVDQIVMRDIPIEMRQPRASQEPGPEKGGAR
jgi:hypothetical protein